jgi:hypothetical protein
MVIIIINRDINIYVKYSKINIMKYFLIKQKVNNKNFKEYNLIYNNSNNKYYIIIKILIKISNKVKQIFLYILLINISLIINLQEKLKIFHINF